MNTLQKAKLKLKAAQVNFAGLSDSAIIDAAENLPTGGAAKTPESPPKRKRPPVNGEAPKTPAAPLPTPERPTDPLQAAIFDICQQQIKSFQPELQIDEVQIIDLIQKHATTTVKFEIKQPDGTQTKIEGQHKIFEDILFEFEARNHVFVHGPAGSGKTTLGHALAESLGFDYYDTGAVYTKYELIGFVDGNGNYLTTSFREAYEKGGVFLFDELDSSAPKAIAALNKALANGSYTFPDSPKPVDRHKDFVVLAAGNTTGRGATRQYVGRNPLDGASRDRFTILEMNYDNNLEKSIAAGVFKSWKGKDTAKLNEYIEKVFSIRETSDKKSFGLIISTRAIMRGASALARGMKIEKALERYVYVDMSEDQRRQIGV